MVLAHAQVAEALASRGAVRASVSLLAALAQDALLEGWLSLAAGLLFRLLEISRPLTVRTRLNNHISITLSSCCHTEHDPHLALRSLKILSHTAPAACRELPLVQSP